MSLETFRQFVTLSDGVRLLLRPLTKNDREAFIQLYANTPPEDLRSLRDDVTDAEIVGGWVDALDYDRVLPILAVHKDRIVGSASLHRTAGSYRHIGEIRIFLAKDFRARGLGTEMIKTLIDLAKRQGLHYVQAEVFASRTKIIRAFESLGFEQRCVAENYFMLPDGTTVDVVTLVQKILERSDEF